MGAFRCEHCVRKTDVVYYVVDCGEGLSESGMESRPVSRAIRLQFFHLRMV